MKLNKLSEKIYYSDFERACDRPALGYVLGDKFSIMIDSGNSKAHLEEFLQTLKENQLPEPNYCIITHWHWDHSFAMAYFKGENIVSSKTNQQLKNLSLLKWDEESVLERVKLKEEIEFAYKAMKEEYTDFGQINISTGDIIFQNNLEIDLGNILCKVELVGGPHEEDSSLIYLEEEKVLFAGDAHSGDYYNRDGGIDPLKMKDYIKVLESIDFNTYIPGHNEPMDKNHIIGLLKTLIK